MGQKVNPIGFRLGVKGSPFFWKSQWFVGKRDYQKFIIEDLAIREFLDKRLQLAGLIETKIERLKNQVKITIQVSRPGVVIGRGGKGLEELKKQLVKIVSIPEAEKNIEIDVEEVKNPDLSARFVAERIAVQIERRMRYRRVVNKAMDQVMAVGALGVKVVLAGRIAGVEVSRVEKFSRGKVPLSSIRANIDYAERPALTRSGYVGVKVYINRGERD